MDAKTTPQGVVIARDFTPLIEKSSPVATIVAGVFPVVARNPEGDPTNVPGCAVVGRKPGKVKLAAVAVKLPLLMSEPV